MKSYPRAWRRGTYNHAIADFCVTMKPTPELWAAAQLVAFANLNVTPANWATLWEGQSRYLCERFPGERGRIIQQRRRAGVAKPAGELWRAFVDGALQIATGRVEGHSGLPALTIAMRFVGVLSPVGGNRQVIEEREFRALHRRTRDWLRRICMGDAQLGDLMSALRRYRAAHKLSVGTVENVFTKLEQWHEEGGWTWQGRRFSLVAPTRPRQPLAEAIEVLFVATGLANLWPRFFQCAAPRCTNFGVARVTRRARNFCSEACRVRTGRRRARQVKTAAKWERTKLEAARRADFTKRWRELQAKGDREAWDKACVEFGYGPAGPPDEQSR